MGMPMLRVDGVAIHPDPSAMTWGLQDVSSSDAGRVHDANATMYKMRITQKRKLNLTWTMLTAEQAGDILRAFNPEYFDVQYFDPMAGAIQTRTFYAGDRSAPYKWYDVKGGKRFATVTFNIIER